MVMVIIDSVDRRDEEEEAFGWEDDGGSVEKSSQ